MDLDVEVPEKPPVFTPSRSNHSGVGPGLRGTYSSTVVARRKRERLLTMSVPHPTVWLGRLFAVAALKICSTRTAAFGGFPGGADLIYDVTDIVRPASSEQTADIILRNM